MRAHLWLDNCSPSASLLALNDCGKESVARTLARPCLKKIALQQPLRLHGKQLVPLKFAQ
jgi:hypothetical protein